MSGDEGFTAEKRPCLVMLHLHGSPHGQSMAVRLFKAEGKRRIWYQLFGMSTTSPNTEWRAGRRHRECHCTQPGDDGATKHRRHDPRRCSRTPETASTVGTHRRRKAFTGSSIRRSHRQGQPSTMGVTPPAPSAARRPGTCRRRSRRQQTAQTCAYDGCGRPAAPQLQTQGAATFAGAVPAGAVAGTRV